MARKALTPEAIKGHANGFVQDIEASILEDIMEFKGTREELAALVQAIKDKVNAIDVDSLFSEMNDE